MIKRRKNDRVAVLTGSLSLAIVCPLTHALDIHYDYTSFDNANTPGANPHFGQNQFNVLNYASINGNYMMTSTDTHRPEMLANHNDLAQFYNNFLADYNAQPPGAKDAIAEADKIQTYSLNNAARNGPRPNWLILNEISSSLWQTTPGPPSDSIYRQWVIDCVTRLHDVYNFDIITYSPYQTVNNAANGASWQALAEKSYIGIECYLSGPEVMAGGSTYAQRVAWAQGQYQASKTSYMNMGVDDGKLFLGEHYANNAAGNGWGRAGISSDDWDQVLQIRQDALYNTSFAGFLAYSWGGNAMAVTEEEQLQHEYYYRSRLVLPTQKPQWLSDTAISLQGVTQTLSWGYALNWIGGVPDGTGAIANFYRTNTAARTIPLDGSRTVGTLSFDSSFGYTITPGTGGTLTLNNNVSAASVSVPTGSHTIAAGVVLGGNVNIDVAGSISITGGMSDSAARTITRTGNGTLTIAGSQSYAAGTILNANAGATNLNSDGGPNLTINDNSIVTFASSQRLAGLSIASGKLAAVTSGGAKILNVGTLSIGAGKLNLNDNDAIVRSGTVGTFNGTSYTGLTGSIAAGRNGGSWNGTAGIVASASGTLTGLGIAAASDIGVTATALWNSQSVNSTDTLIMYTYVGDATLDGKINIDDYTRIDAGVASGTSGWSNGDFNYDGKVNVDDYMLIDNNITMQSGSLASAGGVTESLVAIPEPAAATLLSLPILAQLPRRRRRRGRSSDHALRT